MFNQNCRPDMTPSLYKGLESYTEHDGALLFGRNEERDRLVYSLQSSRLTVLYGARQIGKSSLLRAGVVHQLRQNADRRAGLGNHPALAVVVFDEWSGGDTIGRLSSAINHEFERLGVPPGNALDLGNFVERCKYWTSCLGVDGGELFLVLDHFDHHLMMSPCCETEPGAFDVELSKVLSTRGLAVNILIAIRDELLAYLDRYRTTVPGLYSNLFRLEPLTLRQAREAIQNPVYVSYNEAHVDDKIGIEAELIRAVLDSTAMQRGVERPDGPAPDERFDTGGLQLAMQAVWDREMSEGSRTLRNATFATLGGVRGIAADYVNKRFGAFEPREQYLSAKVFDHLLTPGGVGVAYQLSDLAKRMGDVTTDELTALIRKLREERMVVTSVSGETMGLLYYETAHRVLTPAMLERVQSYHLEKNKREKDILSAIEISLHSFFETSQVDGLNKIIETSEQWSEGVRNLLVDGQLQSDIRGALAKMVHNLTQKGQLAGYKGAVSSVCYSRDGKFIVTGTEAGSLKIWDVRSPGHIESSTEQNHKTWIWGLSASADGKWIATGSDDGTVGVWAVTDTGVRFCRPIPFAPDAAAPPLVRGVSFSPDGSLLAIAATDGRVRLWHLYEERIWRDFAASPCAVRCVAFAPDGRTLATGADDGMVGLWNTDGDSLVPDDQRSRFRHDSAVWGVRFQPMGERLASCSEDHRIKVWNMTTKNEEQTLIGHCCWVLDIDYNADGTLLASASEDGTARIWDQAGNEVAALVHGAPVNGVSFSPDGLTVVTAAADCKVRLWNVQQNRNRRSPKRFRHPKKAILLDVSFSSDGTRVATGGTDSQAQIWNQEDGQIVRTLAGHRSWIMCVEFHPSVATLLATGSIDGTARVWNILDGSNTTITPNDGPVWSIAFSRDGRFLATGTAGGKACVWDLLDRQDTPATAFSSDQGSIWSIGFTPDGKWIAAGCQDGSIQIRDLTGRDVMQLRGVHAGQVLSLSFSPDAKYLASASSEGRICVWDICKKEKMSVRDLDAPIWSVVFNRTGEMLASGSVNRSVCLWTPALERLGVYSAEGPIRGLGFSRTGQWLAGACSDGTVRLWPIGDDDFGSLLERAKSERDKMLPFVWPQAAASVASA
jgi:WD40 repeat protein